MSETLTTFTVYRKTWGRDALLNRDGSRCCLGHYCKQAGVPDSAMRDDAESEPFAGRKCYPSELPDSYKALLPDWMVPRRQEGIEPWVSDARTIGARNDEPQRSEDEIARLFAHHGIVVVFSDDDEPQEQP